MRRALLLILVLAAARAGAEEYTAVASRTSNDYERAQTVDKRFRQETYALGIGGDYSGTEKDPASESVKFADVVRAIAAPLAAQDYISTKDPNKTQLLIMVYWGITTGTGTPAAATYHADIVPGENKASSYPDNVALDNGRPPNPRGLAIDQMPTDSGEVFNRGVSDSRNASILGYDSGLVVPDSAGITPLHLRRDDLLDEVRHNRYFVVLMAYDFQRLWKQRQHKLVWETRFSVRQQDTDFGKILPSMARYASQYFGKDTFGLLRRPLPEGDVEVGIPKAVASLPDAAALPAETALLGAPSAAEAQAQKWTTSTVPPELAQRIEEYKRDRAALMQDLSSRLAAKTWRDDSHHTLDAFNAENSGRIAMLSRTAQGIRADLAQIAAPPAGQVLGDQPVNALVRQFNSEIRDIDVTEPILTHP
ncbi:MAG TPA: hypothetical protein VFE25_16545 [Opitutaceae bacterium]|jgi:hypothetical protein|nr:hypothetical protein [Opitutaceae bacterium]